MPLFDDDIERESFRSDDDYIEYRIREGMEGKKYDYDSDTVVDWAQSLINTYQWNALAEWMHWDWEDMQDFFDWWRELYDQ